MIKIAVDAMGGDNAPEATVLGAQLAVKKFKDIELTLYGDETKIRQYLKNDERIKIVHTDSYIDMGEHDPIRQIRTNRKSSLVLAMKSCKEGENDGLVTAGPTQAVIVGAHIIIKKIPQMSRVALAPIIPNADGTHKIMLDVGANVELRPEHLEELAIYATVAAKVVFGVDNPRVGLLNIGTEPGKGREVDQQTYERLMANQSINFIGNVETKEILTSNCEILLTDGFTGNMVMKAVEGTAKGSGIILKNCIKSSLFGKIGYLFMRKNLKKYKSVLSADDVGGAMLCGVNVPVVKAHGSSDSWAFYNGIRRVRELIASNLVPTVISLLPNKEENNESE